jgi:tetratricopeptide (TPR) repeat protein
MRFTRALPLQICILGTLMLLALAGCGGARARYESHLQRGKQYLEKNNLNKAGIEFRNALQIEPKDADALYYSGRVAEARQQVRQAIALYQAAVDADPSLEVARARLARLFAIIGAPQRALDVISPGLAHNPDDPDLLAARATARHGLQDEQNAIVDAERAVKLAPQNLDAVAALAGLYSFAGDNTRALNLVSEFVSRTPSAFEMREILAQLYLTTAQPAKAEEQMRDIIQLRPRELAARTQLAAHLASEHQTDAAQRVLEDAADDFAHDADSAHRNAAKLALVSFLAAERSVDEGRKKLLVYVHADPGNVELRFGLAALLERSGAWKDALATYREVMEREGTGPQGLVARDRIAAVQLAHGQAAAAAALVGEVLKKNPRDIDALFIRANIALQRNDATSAIADLRAVVRDQPSAVSAQLALARAFIARSQPALAEDAYRAAVQAAPGDPSVVIEFAHFLAQTQHAPQAVSVLEELITRFPGSQPARESLARLYLAQQDLPKARDSTEQLKTRFPDSPAGFYLAGLVAAQERHLEDSQRELEHALTLSPAATEHPLTLSPTATDVLVSLARVQLARGEGAKAAIRVREASDRDPKNVTLLGLLGELYTAQRDFGRATEAFTKASALEPNAWLPHRNLAQVSLAAGDVRGAISEYETALKLAPAEPRIVIELTSVYEKQGRVDDAIARYDGLYAANPESRQLAANNLAMLLVTYRTDQASLDRAQRLTAEFASSENGSLLDTNGWVRFKRREYQEAAAVLERAAARAPDSRVIRYHLGMAEFQLGQRDRARSNLESALAGSAVFSGSEEARTVLASLGGRSG